MDSLFIGLGLCEFCVFSDCFEMKYELECYDILLSTKIDATWCWIVELDDLEYIFCVLSSKDGFDCDTSNVFKYWCDKNYNGNYDCNIHINQLVC